MTVLPLLPEADAIHSLENKAVLVTVNKRLAGYLRRRFNQHQVDAGKTVWETPDILPYDAWLGRAYDAARYLPDKDMTGHLKMPLTPAQAHYVWEQVIGASESGNALLRVPETAKAAGKAWEICRQWHLNVHELSQAPPEDTAAFLGWAGAFDQKCRENSWLDNAGLPGAVIQLFKSGHVPAPAQLILAGFDELSPQQALLVKTLEAIGCRVYSLADSGTAPVVCRCEPADTEAEITAAARWTRARLAENPSSRIGIIVQDIRGLRQDLVRIFDDVLHPSLVLSPHTAGKRVYNISLGQPLADYPVVRTALMILNFAYCPLFVEEYSRLLRSPFLAGAEAEFSGRAMLDARIRENGETALSVSDMIYFSGMSGDKDRPADVFCPQLNKRLDAFKKAIAEIPKKQRPSAWVQTFLTLLDSMGWSNGRKLNSEEFQAVNAWHEALQAFSAYDLVADTIDLQSAIRLLAENIHAKNFQPETDDVPVQIMGMLEVVGERFDHAWIMGLDAESWPAAAQPNPFLPVSIQKKYNVPHASPERELAYARQLTRRLLSCADHVIVSSPQKDGDTILYPSPLIAHLKNFKADIANENRWLEIFDAAEFEQVSDPSGPAADAKSRISGGTGLLKAQAACPFSAFAAYRLKAKALEVPESGLNARERGSLIHNALEHFWEDVKTLDAMKKLSDAALFEAVGSAVDRAVSAMAKKHPRTFTARFTQLEKERLTSLTLEFLAVDAQRTSFTVIDREKKLVRMIADIELKTYADRIDRLDDGRLVIVDYKTGEPKVADWFTDRIAEPQLPLYSFAVDEEVAGVVFAHVKKGNVKYLGVAADMDIIPGVSGPETKKGPLEQFSSLNDVIALWQNKIEFLADEVRQGLAAVSPVSVQKSCVYCDLGPLCRIGEASFLK